MGACDWVFSGGTLPKLMRGKRPTRETWIMRLVNETCADDTAGGSVLTDDHLSWRLEGTPWMGIRLAVVKTKPLN